MSLRKRFRVSIFEANRSEPVSDLFAKKLKQIETSIATGNALNIQDMDALTSLATLKGYLAKERHRRRIANELLILCIVFLILGGLSFIRLRTTAVDINVEATSIRFQLKPDPSMTLIPGESEQVLELKQVEVLNAETILSPTVISSSTIEVNALPISAGGTSKDASRELPARLQAVTLPAGYPENVTVQIAYNHDESGVAIKAKGSQPVKALIGEPISIGVDPGARGLSGTAYRPITAEGRDLALELQPIVPNRGLTIFRDVHISEFQLDDSGRSTLLGGTAYIKASSVAKITFQPSDVLVLNSDTPILLRELTFVHGKLRAIMSVPRASVIALAGDVPRDLKPTLFDFIRYRWPAELYATLSALAVAWLGIRTWMRGTE